MADTSLLFISFCVLNTDGRTWKAGMPMNSAPSSKILLLQVNTFSVFVATIWCLFVKVPDFQFIITNKQWTFLA